MQTIAGLFSGSVSEARDRLAASEDPLDTDILERLGEVRDTIDACADELGF